MPESYKPTAAMASAARRAKKMRDSQPPSNQGMTRVGLERMNQLIDREPLSLETVKRMYSFFSRHEVDKQSKSWKEGDSKAEQAWLGWGGDAGYAWSRKIVEQQERENNMQTERAQLVRAVNKSQIIKHAKGWTIRDVVPVVDDIVMNGGLYPAAELNQSYESLEGVPAPIGHPRDEDGNYISAMRGNGLRKYYAGITVENVRKEGERVLVDLEVNQGQMESHPRYEEIVAELNSGESMHVSTGLLLQRNQETGISRGKKYNWRATNMQFDHLALLPSWEGPGAATPEDGVGIMANSAELYVNLDEYDAEQDADEVEERIANSVLDKLRQWFQPGYNANHAQSMPTSDSGDSDMTPEEVKELVDNQLAEFSANMDGKMDEKDKKIAKLEEELNAMKEKYEANEAAELEAKVNRAVELTKEDKAQFEGMTANALDMIIKAHENQGAAWTVNADLPVSGKKPHEFDMAE